MKKAGEDEGPVEEIWGHENLEGEKSPLGALHWSGPVVG